MKVTAIIGTYRKGGTIDAAVGEILASAHDAGAEVETIYLIDRHIEFCTNCRTCTQQPGLEPGACVHEDDLRGILDAIARSDALVLASPVNFFTVTAVMKRFIERLVGFAYWPWGQPAPKRRNRLRDKRAVLVVSSAAPSLLARLSFPIAGLMKTVAGLLGARTVGVLRIGLAAQEPHADLGERTRSRARRLGRALVAR
jgi:multimeric flavodoxin WrbA